MKVEAARVTGDNVYLCYVLYHILNGGYRSASNHLSPLSSLFSLYLSPSPLSLFSLSLSLSPLSILYLSRPSVSSGQGERGGETAVNRRRVTGAPT